MAEEPRDQNIEMSGHKNTNDFGHPRIEVISLAEREKEIPSDYMKRIHWEEHQSRINLTDEVRSIFKKANAIVLTVLVSAYAADCYMIYNDMIEPSDRLVTSGVLQVLIGATVVQVGAIMFGISRYLFPARGLNSENSPPLQG